MNYITFYKFHKLLNTAIKMFTHIYNYVTVKKYFSLDTLE